MGNRAAEIQKRFQESWTDTERFLSGLIDNGGFDILIPVLDYIEELKQSGEWKYFRLGTSMYAIVFSRSVNNGLRYDQKYVKINTLALNDYEVVFRNGNELYREYRITDLKDIQLAKVLRTLKGTLVD